MSYMKRFFEDIEVMIQSGMEDEDIVDKICHMYGVNSKDGWVLKQVKAAREQILEMED